MSLFDVIRYPISDPPTIQEITRLPEDLYLEWINCTTWRSSEKKLDRSHIIGFYSYIHDGNSYRFEADQEDIDALRGIIRRYNP